MTVDTTPSCPAARRAGASRPWRWRGAARWGLQHDYGAHFGNMIALCPRNERSGGGPSRAAMVVALLYVVTMSDDVDDAMHTGMYDTWCSYAGG